MGRRGPAALVVELTEDERETLQRWARRPKTEQSLASRCQIVLACAEGLSNTEVGKRLKVHPAQCGSGGCGSWRSAWTACMTSLVRGRTVSSVTTRSRR
jgi:hypothetical protein